MTSQNQHNPLLGYFIGFSAQIGLVMTAALSQKLRNVPTFQKLYFLQFQACVWTYFISKKMGIEYTFKQREKLFWALARAGIGILAFGMYIYALVLLPLSEATVVNMLVPVTAGIFSAIFLKERYDISMLLITICSLTGVIFIAKPGFLFPNVEIDPKFEHRILGIIVLSISATLGGFAQIIMKKASALVHPFVLASYFGLLSGIVFAVVSLFTGAKSLTTQEIIYLLISGCTWSFGSCGMVLQYKFGQASRLSVLFYAQVFLAFFYDIVIEGLTPDYYSVLGGFSISLCILILLWKVYNEEGKKKQEEKLLEHTERGRDLELKDN